MRVLRIIYRLAARLRVHPESTLRQSEPGTSLAPLQGARTMDIVSNRAAPGLRGDSATDSAAD